MLLLLFAKVDLEMKLFVINLSVFVFSIFPSFLRRFIWDLTKPFGQLPFLFVRYSIARSEMECCGDDVYFGCNVTLKNAKNIKIGDRVSFHDNCYLDGYGGIEIGSDVAIAHATTIMSTNHTWGDPLTPIKYNKAVSSRVLIGDDVWLGCGVRILSGVVIPNRVVVAAGAVVTPIEMKSNSLYAGVPAKMIKAI